MWQIEIDLPQIVHRHAAESNHPLARRCVVLWSSLVHAEPFNVREVGSRRHHRPMDEN
jgi:hypothetical protein